MSWKVVAGIIGAIIAAFVVSALVAWLASLV